MVKSWPSSVANIATSSGRVVGSIDTLVGRILYGWIYYPDLPDAPVSVNVCVDRKPVAAGVADLYREDLEQAGKGNGLHAFQIELPKDCFDDQLHTIEVQDSASGTFLPVQLDEVRLDSREKWNVRGVITGLRGTDIVGYAYDRRDPKSPIAVGLFVDGQELARGAADQATPSGVSSAGIPSRCGFAIPIANLDLNKLVEGRAMVASVPEMEVIDVYESFGRDFARLSVRKHGDVLVATIDVVFIPAQPLSLNMFVNGELYATIDVGREPGLTSFPISIFSRDLSASTTEVSVSYYGSEVQIGNSPQVVRQNHNLLKNSRFERWEGAAPAVWQLRVANGVGISKGFGGAPSAGHRLVLERGEDAASLAGSRLSQTIEAIPEEASQLDVLLEGRADRRMDVVVSLCWGAEEASESNVEKVVTLWPDWGMCAARLDVLPRGKGVPVTLSIAADSGEATRIEFGLVSAGLPGFMADAREGPDGLRGGSWSAANAVNNGSFEHWREALRIRATSRQSSLAGNWLLICKEICPDLEARLVEVNRRDPRAGTSTSSAYGLCLFGPVAGKSLRLQTDLNKLQLANLDHGYFSFTRSKASTLVKHHDERKNLQTRIGDIFIVERQIAEDTHTVRETQILSLKSRLEIPPQPEKFETALSAEQSNTLRLAANRVLYDQDKSLTLVFEFTDFADCVLTDVTLGSKPEREARLPRASGYVAIEDSNISAQLPLLKGLDLWRSSDRLYPPKLDKATPIKAAPVWEWLPHSSHSVDIVVCVHDAIEESLACLDSVRNCTEIPHTVTIVDDASAGGAREQLRQYARDLPWVRLITLDHNLGYTRAANVGLMSSKADWVVLLNSDTIVSPGWLTGMFEVVAAKPDVGLVGPLSNAASWQSVPDLTDVAGKWKVNQLPEGYTVAEMAELVRSLSMRGFPEVPLLNGFCTLMRRSALEEVGFLDEVAFPIGYGEENDLCVRVARAGYKLAIADHVYVYHVKSATFGTKGRDLNQLQQVLADSTPLFELRKALRRRLQKRADATSPECKS